MRQSVLHGRVAVAAAVALLLAACASSGDKDWVELMQEDPGSEPTFTILGTIQHLQLEGGLFVISDAQGRKYNPLNLPPAFQVDGLAVEAQARRRDDVMSIGMVGTIVELVRIRKRPGEPRQDG